MPPHAPLIRGNAIVNVRNFVIERHGAGALDVLAQRLDAASREHFLQARWAEWYPAAVQTQALATYDRMFGDGDLAIVHDIGAYQCMRDLASSLGWVFRLFRPARLVRHMDVVWRRFHDTGHWTSGETTGETWARLHDWHGGSPAACAVLRGYLERLVGEIGGDVTIAHPLCVYRGDAHCEYRVARRFESFATIPFVEIAASDIPAIGRELAQLPSIDATADAIIAIVRSHLPGCDATLLLPDESDPEHFSPVCVIGRRRAEYRHRWILESRGECVGRLDVHFENHDAMDPRLRTISEFVPWFGLALSSAPGRGTGRTVARGTTEWDTLVDHAASGWGLTKRQQDVLRRIVRGASNRQIAIDLGCAEATVEVHVTAIFKKSGANGRAALVARVVEA